MSASYEQNVVIDLEFTSVPARLRTLGLAHEIIELGAVKLDARGQEIGRFSRLVKPYETNRVSRTVGGLTGIGAADLVQAKRLEVVLAEFVKWIGGERTRIVTWSNSDLLRIRTECCAKGIDMDCLPGRWMDIQRLYPRLIGIRGRQVNLVEAADWCGISSDSLHTHRALDDALITAEVFRMMAAGDCGAQREVLDAGIRRGPAADCASSVASRCGNQLEALLASLRLSEAAAGAA